MPEKHWRITFFYQLTFSFLLLYFAETKADGLEKYLPAYAVAAYSNILPNSTCKSELNEFRLGVDRKISWSLKVLDASGQPESGFFYGNNYWLGSKRQCLDLENTEPLKLDPKYLKNTLKNHNISEEFPPFHLNYFISDFHHNNTLQYHLRLGDEDLMALGLCLPASCSTDELGKILKKIFESKTLAIGNLYSANYRFYNVRDNKYDYQWLLDWKIITTCVVLILMTLFAIIGTSYDCIVHQKRLELIKKSESIADKTSSTSAHIMEPNIFGKILLCFSAYTNTKLIFDTKVNKDTIVSIFGLRFLGMLWVCLIHTYLYLRPILNNRITPWRISETFLAQIISNSSFSVDTFFCISGFLISWSFFGKKMNDHSEPTSVQRFLWIKYFGLIFTRIIRLAPLYFLVIGVTEIIFGWIQKTSSFVPFTDHYYLCTNYWWRNVLFIHNIFPWNEMCMYWTWYMSSDMQFYIIGTFLLLLSDIYFYTSAFLLMILLIGSTIISGFISYSHGFTATPDQTLLDLELYSPPWMRISPYLVGMIAGYILTKLNGKLDCSKKTLCLFWVIGSFCNVSTLFGLYGGSISLVSATIYVAFSRIAWSVGIAWILIACHTNNAGIINKILSLKVWIPLSNISYCAYMLNSLIIYCLALTSESSKHLDVYQWVIYFLGLTTFTLLISLIVIVMFGIPPILLYQVIIGMQKKKS